MSLDATHLDPAMQVRVTVHRYPHAGTVLELACERGVLRLPVFATRACVHHGPGDFSLDSDHIVAQYDARDRFDRDRGEGIL